MRLPFINSQDKQILIMMSTSSGHGGNRVKAGTSEFEVVVDKARCCGYGICAEVCPDVYKLDEHGFVYIEGPVPARLAGAAREGAGACPEEALTVREA